MVPHSFGESLTMTDSAFRATGSEEVPMTYCRGLKMWLRVRLCVSHTLMRDFLQLCCLNGDMMLRDFMQIRKYCSTPLSPALLAKNAAPTWTALTKERLT